MSQQITENLEGKVIGEVTGEEHSGLKDRALSAVAQVFVEKRKKSVPDRRISKELADEIIDNAMKNVYPEEHSALKKRTQEATLLAYRTIVTEEQEKLMNSFPHGFFNVISGKESCRIYRNKTGYGSDYHEFELDFGDGLRMPANCSGYHSTVFKNEAIYDLFDKIGDDANALEGKVSQLRDQIYGLVKSVKTTKKLLAIWPEGKQFIPDWALEETASNLPMVVISDVTNLLKMARPDLQISASA